MLAHTAPRPEAGGDRGPGVNEHWTQGRRGEGSVQPLAHTAPRPEAGGDQSPDPSVAQRAQSVAHLAVSSEILACGLRAITVGRVKKKVLIISHSQILEHKVIYTK